MSALKRWVLQYMIVIIGVVAAGGAQADAVISNLPDVLAQLRPSVVAVGTFQRTRSPAFSFRGTGFAVGDGTLVATNLHVLPDTMNDQALEQLVVVQQQGKNVTVRNVSKVTTDPLHDLAVLKIVTGAPLPAVTLGDSDKVREGQAVALSGFPIGNILGLYPVTHLGIISTIAPITIPASNSGLLNPRMVRMLTDEPFNMFQLDATSYPGHSGSPLYEADSGKVIGIVNLALVKGGREGALSQPTGISYAIPSKHLQVLLKTLNK